VTGLLLDRAGNVLTTNFNLGRKAGDVRVVLVDGRKLAADVLARDPPDDLALLRVAGGVPEDVPVPPLRWAADGGPRAGAFVLALGRSPDPAKLTATLGIVSSPGRNHARLVQTDAALNQGNVGGPLVDLEGRVIGLAAFVGHAFPQWGVNSGIGFGVRADRIREVLPVLARGEEVPALVVPFLGVRAADSPEDPARVGARIREVVPGSSAEAGGLRPNDVIVEWAGAPVPDFLHLRHLIFKTRSGERVSVKVERDGGRVDLELTLGQKALEAME
jgi:serine protease Do